MAAGCTEGGASQGSHGTPRFPEEEPPARCPRNTGAGGGSGGFLGCWIHNAGGLSKAETCLDPSE